jgi:hypothetical protein
MPRKKSDDMVNVTPVSTNVELDMEKIAKLQKLNTLTLATIERFEGIVAFEKSDYKTVREERLVYSNIYDELDTIRKEIEKDFKVKVTDSIKAICNQLDEKVILPLKELEAKFIKKEEEDKKALLLAVFNKTGNKFINFDVLLEGEKLRKWADKGQTIEKLTDLISSEVDRIETEYAQFKDNPALVKMYTDAKYDFVVILKAKNNFENLQNTFSAPAIPSAQVQVQRVETPHDLSQAKTMFLKLEYDPTKSKDVKDLFVVLTKIGVKLSWKTEEKGEWKNA